MTETILVESVQCALNDVISRNFKSTPEITINQGSAAGEGYASKTYSINLKGDGKVFDIFVKYMPEVEYPHDALAFYKSIYSNEIKFYAEIFPAMIKFQEDRNVKPLFNNVAKYHGFELKNAEIPPVLLEDIKILGYTLRDKGKPIDDKHMVLALKAYAKYHALSFALKDQNRKLFEKLGEGLGDMMSHAFQWFAMDAMVTQSIEGLKEVIDPDADKDVFDRLPTLAETLVSFSSAAYEHMDNYSVIGQGDNNSNNLMFLYDKSGDPIDVKLLDWQFLRVNSPVLDLSYLFYTVATKAMLDDLDKYLKCYHDELSDFVRRLGSDPEVLYPHDVFLQHWKNYSKFGLTMAFMVAKLMLLEEDEVPNVLGNSDTSAIVGDFCRQIKHQGTYNRIITDLLRHFIDRGFL